MKIPNITDTVMCKPSIPWINKPLTSGTMYIVIGYDTENNALIVANPRGWYRARVDHFEQVGESVPVPEWVTHFIIDCFGKVVYVDTCNKQLANKSIPKAKVSYNELYSPQLYPIQGIK